jgi:hypothetical protein
MEKKLLQEVNRFRQMVGLNLINEGKEKLIGAISDLKGKASELFGASTRTSPEGIFYMKVNSATDEAAIKRIFNEAANKAFARRLIQKTMIDAGAKVGKTVEYGIVQKFERGETISDVKSKIQTFINSKIESPFQDEIIKYYDDCIDDIFTGKKGEDVFGREVKDPRTPKPSPDPSVPPRVDLVAAKKSMKSMADGINNSEVREYVNKEIDNLTEDTLPADPSIWVLSKIDGIGNILKKSKDIDMELMERNQKKIGTVTNSILNENLPKRIKLGAKTTWALLGLGLAVGVLVVAYNLWNDPVDEYESWKRKFTKSAEDSGVPRENARKAADEAVESGKEIRKKGKGSYIKRK